MKQIQRENTFETNSSSVHCLTLYKIDFNIRFARRCVLNIIKTMIDDGYYVAFYGVDDYYIKGKCWYKEQHMDHEGMIIGYGFLESSFPSCSVAAVAHSLPKRTSLF